MQPTSTTPNDPRSLAELAASAAAGDKSAFAALHKRLSGGIRRLFLDRSGNKAEVADDLLQRTWVGVWQSLSRGRYDPAKSAISTFVYAVAHKMWLQHLRATPGARPTGGDDSPIEGLEATDSPMSETGLAEVLDVIRACLRGNMGDLTTDEREILRLCGSGASDRDLAARLSVSPSTANARKRAAMEKLRRHLAAAGHRPESHEPERSSRRSE
jgi:RNA polymerase sigma factor (sigma-70 family)